MRLIAPDYLVSHRTRHQTALRRTTAPRRVYRGSCELIDKFAQEQEIVKGQEGPQEEGPGPLRPQGLVLYQGTSPPLPKTTKLLARFTGPLYERWLMKLL